MFCCPSANVEAGKLNPISVFLKIAFTHRKLHCVF